MERCLFPRFDVRSDIAQQLNEAESRHSTSRILLLSKSREPSGDEACSSTVV